MTNAADVFTDKSITIKLSREAWRQLNALKEPAETFNDVILRVLAEARESAGKAEAKG